MVCFTTAYEYVVNKVNISSIIKIYKCNIKRLDPDYINISQIKINCFYSVRMNVFNDTI